MTAKNRSLWSSATVGLLVGAIFLFLQALNDGGYELASYGHTASSETIAALVGSLLPLPMLFAVGAYALNRRSQFPQGTKGSAVFGASVFILSFLCIIGLIVLYGSYYFLRDVPISGKGKDVFIKSIADSCASRQRNFAQNVTTTQIDKYCSCVGMKVAEQTTYKQLGSGLDPDALTSLRRKAEAAGYACQP